MKPEIKEQIKVAVEARIPELMAEFTGWATRRFAAIILHHGVFRTEDKIRSRYNGEQQTELSAWRVIERAIVILPKEHPMAPHEPTCVEPELHPDRLEALARTYAHDVVETWFGKIIEKLVDVDSIEIPEFSHGAFVINATRGGHHVRLEQIRVWKWSNGGKWGRGGKMFNQYPARFRIDGKAATKAQYDAMFAKEEA